MLRPRVYVSRQIFPDALDLIEKTAEIDLWPEENHHLQKNLRKPCRRRRRHHKRHGPNRRAFLDAAPKLKVLSQVAVGLDNIDIPEATRRGILLAIHLGYWPNLPLTWLLPFCWRSPEELSRATSGFARAIGRSHITLCSGGIRSKREHLRGTRPRWYRH
ncbi:MAG: hypothetical protein CM1200mP27_05180 [Chloroflexota bacterium]|nr:MAG: hypothetical protein CM1200mP27_05180 [Chloroflexota bacterium]